MHLDSNLSWTLHMGKLLKKLSTACYMMRNLYYYLTLDSLKTVYFTYFQSLAIWDNFLGHNYKPT